MNPMPGKPPTSADHLSKAEDNKQFGLGMIRTHHVSAGWALTAMFYSAVHFAAAYLCTIGVTPETHGDRTDEILNRPELSEIYKNYRHLSDRSFNARYKFNIYGKHDVDQAIPSLERIEQHIRSLLVASGEVFGSIDAASPVKTRFAGSG
jgi:hypothetical protein